MLCESISVWIKTVIAIFSCSSSPVFSIRSKTCEGVMPEFEFEAEYNAARDCRRVCISFTIDLHSLPDPGTEGERGVSCVSPPPVVWRKLGEIPIDRFISAGTLSPPLSSLLSSTT